MRPGLMDWGTFVNGCQPALAAAVAAFELLMLNALGAMSTTTNSATGNRLGFTTNLSAIRVRRIAPKK